MREFFKVPSFPKDLIWSNLRESVNLKKMKKEKSKTKTTKEKWKADLATTSK